MARKEETIIYMEERKKYNTEEIFGGRYFNCFILTWLQDKVHIQYKEEVQEIYF